MDHKYYFAFPAARVDPSPYADGTDPFAERQPSLEPASTPSHQKWRVRTAVDVFIIHIDAPESP
jgi:hypothetical protein